MNKHNLDAIVAPTTNPAWPTDLVNGDRPMFNSSTLAAVAGYPAITVPAGNVFGLPVGISFFGRAWSEPILIRLAYAFEQAVRARKQPHYLQTFVCETGHGLLRYEKIANLRLKGMSLPDHFYPPRFHK